ncbi:MAG: hypothetical protein DK305_000732 [Chloroflexi bacterium]|jgi:hypothetical protein|nr:MAG: hypothetical protein DK305_000732 [Chloroflexota bacterium]
MHSKLPIIISSLFCSSIDNFNSLLHRGHAIIFVIFSNIVSFKINVYSLEILHEMKVK